MSPLPYFEPRVVGEIPLEMAAVSSDQVAHGHPGTGSALLATAYGAEVGVWEMTAGGMFDVEADEIFIVTEGDATVTLLVDGADSSTIDLRPGTICRLAAGMTTRWDVPVMLRKVYISRAEADRS